MDFEEWDEDGPQPAVGVSGVYDDVPYLDDGSDPDDDDPDGIGARMSGGRRRSVRFHDDEPRDGSVGSDVLSELGPGDVTATDDMAEQWSLEAALCTPSAPAAARLPMVAPTTHLSVRPPLPDADGPSSRDDPAASLSGQPVSWTAGGRRRDTAYDLPDASPPRDGAGASSRGSADCDSARSRAPPPPPAMLPPAAPSPAEGDTSFDAVCDLLAAYESRNYDTAHRESPPERSAAPHRTAGHGESLVLHTSPPVGDALSSSGEPDAIKPHDPALPSVAPSVAPARVFSSCIDEVRRAVDALRERPRARVDPVTGKIVPPPRAAAEVPAASPERATAGGASSPGRVRVPPPEMIAAPPTRHMAAVLRHDRRCVHAGPLRTIRTPFCKNVPYAAPPEAVAARAAAAAASTRSGGRPRDRSIL